MIKSILNKDNYPWYKFYGEVPHHLDYFKGSMTEYIMETALKYPNISIVMITLELVLLRYISISFSLDKGCIMFDIAPTKLTA